MAVGSLRVSFAGTYAEAVAYAAQHPHLTAPKGLARAGDDGGLPMLCAVYHGSDERHRRSRQLALLGWDEEFQCDVRRGSGFKGDRS